MFSFRKSSKEAEQVQKEVAEAEAPKKMEEKKNQRPVKRVVIVGAGPAGLLAAIMLLRRNANEGAPVKYQVTLVDPGVDYGTLDKEGLTRYRSWMIGLSAHGLKAIREVPGLYEDYVQDLGVNVSGATISLGPTFKFNPTMPPDFEGFTVDRNFICAALARFLTEKFPDPKEFKAMYHTRALFVDGPLKNVMVRSTKEDTNQIDPVPYDVLLGCDGIRSVVRSAFMHNHREFEFDLKGSFGMGKSVHVARPASVKEGEFLLLIECMPNIVMFGLPETDGKLNMAMGHALDKKPAPELYSDDPTVVADYFRKNFKLFELDWEEVGKVWVAQELLSTQQVHCNFYHSTKLSALLMGDAAHATVPNIGQGMNTALDDASALNKLLDSHNDAWEKVLPAFSEERVKEGNALTDLSFHSYSLDPSKQIMIMLGRTFRIFLNKILPRWLVDVEAMQEIPNRMKLSEAFDRMIRYGGMKEVRRANEEKMREHFERSVGMIKAEKGSSFFAWVLVPFVVFLAAAGSYYYFTLSVPVTN